jgi:hypothetical protein
MPGSVAEPQTEVAQGSVPTQQPPGRSGGSGRPGADDGRRGANAIAATGIVVGDPASDTVPQLSLRPLTVADILDGAFGIIKVRARLILGFTALLVTPLYLFVAYSSRNQVASVGLLDLPNLGDPETAEAFEDESGGIGEPLLDFAGHGLILVAVAAAIAYMLGAWSAGRDVSAGELLGMVARRSWALAASFVLVHVVEMVGFLGLVVGALFLMPLFVAVAPVIGAENVGPLQAISRSARLTSARYWPTLGISLLIGVIAFVLNMVLTLWVLLPIEVLGWDLAWPLAGLANIMAAVVTTPFVAAASVLLYLDLRMQVEGLDLQLTAQDVFPEKVT